MGPIAEETKELLGDKSVKFVLFDFTTEETTAASKAEAEALGVAGTYAENAPNTGFALVYDTKTQKVVTKLSASDDAAKWRSTIEGVLGG